MIEDARFAAADGTQLHGWYLPHPRPRAVVLFCHGNAGNITSYWKGYVEYNSAGKASKRPVMMGFQAEGAAPIVKGHIVDNPETIATAIRIVNPASWQQAKAARDESGGVIDSVTDDQILSAYNILATKEGIFGEPASASSLARDVSPRCP